ncbi:unnamed protein product [Ceratitis capitata]|uniref:(Mediterranean fruit fly) hypothetical protein n=1 Tax=Ceratitis capitata TaxID=7213 RepID=A0A811UXU8_CERCA|nr:unnamed protein product [Ceratitis capitata]
MKANKQIPLHPSFEFRSRLECFYTMLPVWQVARFTSIHTFLRVHNPTQTIMLRHGSASQTGNRTVS